MRESAFYTGQKMSVNSRKSIKCSAMHLYNVNKSMKRLYSSIKEIIFLHLITLNLLTYTLPNPTFTLFNGYTY